MWILSVLRVFSFGILLSPLIFLLPDSACAVCVGNSFSLTTVDGGNYAPNTVRFGDLDGDGDKDIVSGSSAAAGDLGYYLNNGSGTYGSVQNLSSSQESQYAIELIDVDVDGDIDIVSSDRYGENVAWYENNGGLSFTQRSIVTGLTSDSVYDIAVGDLDGDTDIDVVAAVGGAADDVNWYRNNGNDTFTAMTAVDSNFPGALTLDIGDMDADGDMDVLALSPEVGGGASYYLNNGSGSFTETSLTTSPRQNGRIVDLDTDGDKDLLTVAQNAIYWHANTSGSFGGATSIASGSYTFISLAVADIDGDSDMDFATTESSNGGVSWWKNSGSQSFTEQIIASTGYMYDIAMADVTADGNHDITTVAMNPDNDVHLFVQTCDSTAPTITSITSNTANGSYAAGSVIDIDITFSEIVTSSGSITITLETGATDRSCTLTVSSSTAGTCNYTVIAGDTSADLTVASITGTITDAANNTLTNFVPISNLAASSAIVIDTTAPSVSSFSPLDNAVGVTRTANLVLTFQESVQIGSGNITIINTAQGSTFETIAVGSGMVTGGGTSTITINPTGTFAEETAYAVQVASGGFTDSAGNAYAGINTNTMWNFTVGDFTAPTITTLSPQNDSQSISINPVLVITFSEAVTVSSGSLILKRTNDNTTIENIPANGALVSGSGSTGITIDPSVVLARSVDYYLTIENTAFTDASGNAFAGINDSSVWSFTTQGSSSAGINMRPRDYTISQVQAITPATDRVRVTWLAGSDVPAIFITFEEKTQGFSWTTDALFGTTTYTWPLPHSLVSGDFVATIRASDLAQTLSFMTSDPFTLSRPTAQDSVMPTETPLKTPQEKSITQEVARTTSTHGPSPVNGKEEMITAVKPGMYIKSPSFPTVYFITESRTRRPFPHAHIFFTYEESFAPIVTVSDATLPTLPLDNPMLPKPGVVLVKMPDDHRTYAIDPAERLHLIPNEPTAIRLFGPQWNQYILDISPILFSQFLKQGQPVEKSTNTFSASQLKTRLHLSRLLHNT